MVVEPFYRRDRVTGNHAFMHPCRVCGSEIAPFGFGVELMKGKPGRWYCGIHKEQDDDSRKAEQTSAALGAETGADHAPDGLPEVGETGPDRPGHGEFQNSLFD